MKASRGDHEKGTDERKENALGTQRNSDRPGHGTSAEEKKGKKCKEARRR